MEIINLDIVTYNTHDGLVQVCSMSQKKGSEILVQWDIILIMQFDLEQFCRVVENVESESFDQYM